MIDQQKLTDLEFIFYLLLNVEYEEDFSEEIYVGLGDLIESQLVDENSRLKRIPYELIAEQVFNSDETEGEDNESFLAHIERLKRLPENIKDKACIDIFCEKVIRHYRLSKIQRDYIDRNINSLKSGIVAAETKLESFNHDIFMVRQNIDDQLSEVQDSVDNSKIELERKIQESNESMSTTKEKLMSEFVGILGIFSGLIFAFFGGINTVQNALSELANGAPIGKSIIMLSFTAAGLISFLYFTLSWIGKLMDKSIYSCKCKQANCHHSILQRHATYFFIMLLLLLFCILGSLVMVSKYAGITSSINSWILIIVLLFSLIIVFISMFKLINKNNNES